MSTKIDLINGAYSRARISGLTSSPTPSDISLAIDRLEDMAAMWQAANICTDYNFEDDPDSNSPHNLERKYWSAYKSNLAMLLLADFGKNPHPGLVREARASFAQLSSSTANPTQIQYPSRQPIGSGNLLRRNRFGKFYRKQASAPNECDTASMLIDDVNDFTEHYDSYLKFGETISSYTIEPDSGLTVSNDSLTSPDISYRITVGSDSGTFKVKIVTTSSLGRVETRYVNFIVRDE